MSSSAPDNDDAAVKSMAANLQYLADQQRAAEERRKSRNQSLALLLVLPFAAIGVLGALVAIWETIQFNLQ